MREGRGFYAELSPLPRHRALVDHIFILRDRGALTGPERSVFATPFRETALVAGCPDDGRGNSADLTWQLMQTPPRFRRQSRTASLHGWMIGVRSDPLAAGRDELSRVLWDRSGDLAAIIAEDACCDAVVAWFDDVLETAMAARSDEQPVTLLSLSARGPAAMTVARLADAANVTPRTLRRHVRARTGLSPKRYATLQRFNAALHEVAGGNDGFAEVAMAAGYSDQSHMTADLTQHTGAPPGRLRAFARRQGVTDAARYFEDATVRGRVTVLLTAPDPS